MNLQLTEVLSDIVGKIGLAILRAIVAGERDGTQLAKLRDRRVRADEARSARSLTGNWRTEHVFALTLALQRYEFLQAQIAHCEAAIDKALIPLPRVEVVPMPPFQTAAQPTPPGSRSQRAVAPGDAWPARRRFDSNPDHRTRYGLDRSKRDRAGPQPLPG